MRLFNIFVVCNLVFSRGGISMKTLTSALEKVLADTYALFLKTQNYHWNIEGCCFKENH